MNTGWWFYKEYWRLAKLNRGRAEEMLKLNVKLTNEKFIPAMLVYANRRMMRAANFTIRTKVIGEGWLAGISNRINSELKNTLAFGLTFDHTSGLPFVTGSQLKGNLNAIFKEEEDYIKEILGECMKADQITSEEIKTIQNSLFKKHHIDYLGGLPIRNLKFELGVNTPHESIIKKPKPLPFIKVANGTEFNFYFKIRPAAVDNAKAILSKLLGTQGVGAKKNYDFSYFEVLEVK